MERRCCRSCCHSCRGGDRGTVESLCCRRRSISHASRVPERPVSWDLHRVVAVVSFAHLRNPARMSVDCLLLAPENIALLWGYMGTWTRVNDSISIKA